MPTLRYWMLLIVAGFPVPAAHAQLDRIPPRPRPQQSDRKPRTAGEINTQISVEISAGKEGAGIPSLKWRTAFEELGIPISIQPGGLNKEPETTEEKVGNLRRVTVRGQLDRSGRLVFAGRSFSPNEAAKLRAWIDDLKTFGAQGSPAGQPVWGLSQEQFADLYSALSIAMTEEVAGLPLEAAVARFGLPASYPLEFSQEARRILKDAADKGSKVRSSLLGFSKGTALAIALAEHGLAFRPVRSASGEIGLAIIPRNDEQENAGWPIGWEPKGTRPETAPKLFGLLPIELDDAPLVDVVAAISARSEIAIFYDYSRIEAKGISLDTLKVSYKPRQSSYSLLLQSITLAHRLNHVLKIDELGRPFVWISTIDVRQPPR
jgi:hypothetical protein